MTIKHITKSVSAEKQPVVTDITPNNNGLIVFTLSNLRDGESTTKTIDLTKYKLKMKKITAARLRELENAAANSDDAIEREAYIFLVPFEAGEEGHYREYIWDSTQNEFEVIGSTKVDLEPFLQKAKVLDNITTSTFVSSDPTALSAKQGYLLNQNKIDKTSIATNLTTDDDTKVLSAKQGKILKDSTDTLQSTKVTVEQGKGLSEANFTNAEKTKLSNIQIVDTVADGNSGAVTSNAVYDTINGLNYIDGTDYEEVEVTVTYANNGGTDSLLILAKRSS